MIARTDLRKIARARLKDAKVLLESRRYDGAVYLVGYAVEIALKARICRTLKWPGYPFTGKEFRNYQSFRTHDLDSLLSLSGVEAKIKRLFLTQWSVVARWEPSVRYKPVGTASEQEALDMHSSAQALIKGLV